VIRTKGSAIGPSKGQTSTPATDYKGILSKMVETMRPGGEAEQSQFANIEKAGQRYGAQLEAGAISRGLGNVAMGNETLVAENVSAARQQASDNVLSRYIQALQFIANLEFQGQQADANRAVSTQQTQVPGLDAFGSPMPGSMQQAEIDLANKRLGLRQQELEINRNRPSAEQFPSLYNAGGYSGTGEPYSTVPTLPSILPQSAGIAPGGSTGYGETYNGRTAGTPFVGDDWGFEVHGDWK